MAPEIDLIVEMLRELKRVNSNSSDSFNKLLTSLSRKVDTIDRNTASTELIKGYLTDLAKSTEEKYSSTLAKFTDIEKAIRAILIEQDEHAKNHNLQELVDIFSKNMNNIYSEARQQKAVLNGIEEKITNISSDKSDKDAIISTISLLRTDFENVNNSYKSIIDSINAELKNILSNIIKIDQTTINSQISAQLELVSRATNEIINYLDSMDKRDANLEKILLNVATSESLKLTKEVIDSIMEKTDRITDKINNLTDQTEVNTNTLTERLEETATKELFVQLSDTTNSLIMDVEEIKQTLAKVTTNIDNLADTQSLENSLQQVFNKLKNLNKDIERTNAKQDIIDLENKLETLNLEFATIKNIIIDLSDVVNSKISTAINDISFEQECYEIKNHISKMLSMLPQKEDIERLLENNELGNNLMQEVIKKTDILADKLDNLPTHADMESFNTNQQNLVENLQVVANKDDIENVLKQNEEINDKLSKLNFDDEFEHIYNKSTSIEKWLINSNIKENTNEIANQLPNKAEQKEMLAVIQTLEKMSSDIDELSKNIDVKKVNRTVAEVYQLIEDLKNDFINTTEMHNDSVIVNLSELQKEISSVVTAEDFNNFAEDLKEFVQKTIDDEKSINENISEIKDSQQAIIDNSIETSDAIIDKVESLNKQVKSLHDTINTLTISDNSTALSEINSKIEDLDKQLTNISDFINTLPNSNNSETLDEINNKIKDLDKQLTSISDNVSTLPYSNNSEALNEINRKVDNLDRQILELFEYLNNTKEPNNNEFLDKIAELKEILNTKNSEMSEIGTSNNQITNSIKEYLKDIKNLITNNNSDTSASKKVEELNDSLQDLLATNGNSFAEILGKLNKYLHQQEEAPSTLLQNEMANTLAEVIELKERIIALANTFNEANFPTTSQENNISSFISDKLKELSIDMENLSNNVGSQFQTGFAYNAELLEEKASTISDLIKDLRHESTSNIEFYEKLTSADNKILDIIQEIQLLNTDIITNLNNKNETLLNEIIPIKEAITEISGTDINTTNSTIKEKLDELHSIINGDVIDITNDKASEIIDKLEDSYINISNQITDCENNLRDFILSDSDSVLIKIDNLKTEIEENLNQLMPPDINQMKEFNEFLKQVNEFKLNLENNFADLTDNIKTSLNEQFDKQHQEIKSMLAISLNNEEILNAIENLKNSFNSGAFELQKIEENETTPNSDFGINDFEKEFEQDKSVEILTNLKDNFNQISGTIKDLSEQNIEIKNVLSVIQNKMETLTLHKDNTDSKITNKLVGKDDFDFLEALNYLKTDVQSLHKNINEILPQKEQIQLSKALNSAESASISPVFEELSKKIEDLTDVISKNDWLEEIKTYLANDEMKTLLNEINNKIDILALTDNSDWLTEIKKTIEGINTQEIQLSDFSSEIETKLNLINDKIDILAESNIEPDFSQIEELKNSINNVEAKVDVIASTDYSLDFEDIKYTLDSIDQRINDDNEIPVTEILEAINHKIDIISQADSDTLTQNLDDIKALLLEQSDYINKFEENEKTEAIKKCLNELSDDINNINNQNTDEIQKTIRDMKESIMAAIVTVLDQVSFIEETEEIKDFVEEKTSEINQNLIEVTNQLKQITNANEAPDYTYSMQDIESDLAKLRMALNNIQSNEQNTQTKDLSSILENINKIGNSFDELQNSLTNEEVFELKNKFSQINNDILNLSDRTNQLIIKSGESYSALNTTFEDFSKLITDQLSLKVDTMTKLLENSNASDKVMRQALIYMGEWIDSASASMNKISTNSDEIIDIKTAIEGLKKHAPQQTEILNSIEEKFDEQQERLSFFEKQITKLSILEDQFVEQQERIDKLEMSLEKILSAVEDIDNTKVTRKIDKIDKQIAKLSTNIEKLTSYVD